MDSSGITRDQAERLRQQIQRNLNYMNSLCRRIEKLGFPAKDPLLEAAMKTRHAVQGYRKWVVKRNGTWGINAGTYKNPGRPRTAEHIRQLVLKLARENNWGYTRILGELRKLGLEVSRSTGTVANVGVGTLIETYPPEQPQLRALLENRVAKDAVLAERLKHATLVGGIVGWPVNKNRNKLMNLESRRHLASAAMHA